MITNSRIPKVNKKAWSIFANWAPPSLTVDFKGIEAIMTKKLMK